MSVLPHVTYAMVHPKLTAQIDALRDELETASNYERMVILQARLAALRSVQSWFESLAKDDTIFEQHV